MYNLIDHINSYYFVKLLLHNSSMTRVFSLVKNSLKRLDAYTKDVNAMRGQEVCVDILIYTRMDFNFFHFKEWF